MTTKSIIPQADVDELALWLHKHSNSVSFYKSKELPKACLNRWRALARATLREMPEVLRRYAREAT